MTRGAVWTGLSTSGRGGVAAALARSTLRWSHLTVGVAVVGVLLAGCTGGAPEPGPSPTSAVESPEPSPTATSEIVEAPVRPVEMERSDEAGAVAAATYFLSLFDYVMQTGDLTEWDSVSAQSCGFCVNVHDDAQEIYGTGGTYVGGGFELGEAEVVGFDETLHIHGVQIPYTAAAATVLDSAGGVKREIPAGQGFLLLDVGFSPRGWMLVTGGSHDEAVDE